MKDDLEKIKKVFNGVPNWKTYGFGKEIYDIVIQALEDSKYTVEVFIPETDTDGTCSVNCDFFRLNPAENDKLMCIKGWSKQTLIHNIKLMIPSPLCERGKGE